ncbi:flagellar protein FlaG [Aeromonas rivipollensis]|uniref:Flagellar protein FlaG n=1 Tax=Aeromonas rivipollensis TaxID=948519 RepID=A0ABX0CTH5_9GAMM|nr:MULTISPECIES: flagellar protein FlaG [Aeromonas]MCE9943445.1 flagellar protein FlaG [Aeromonas rivipollensis]NEX87207.1 flagellar protein FlaG [Aeromonas rivipollensis]NEY04428.1 flagellar protein FlaG [Aeromonas rivipollensis]UBO72693.1 flagellar protein FlaG [Aeromonas rivuli]
MANESIAMPSVTSTLTQHGGPQAAMAVSPPTSSGEELAEQTSVEPTAKTSQAQAKVSEPRMDKAYMEKQAQELQERLDNLSKLKGWTINFSLVPEFDQPVIKVIDAETKQVIRQIPSEEMLLISKRLQSMDQQMNGNGSGLSGLLFDGQV